MSINIPEIPLRKVAKEYEVGNLPYRYFFPYGFPDEVFAIITKPDIVMSTNEGVDLINKKPPYILFAKVSDEVIKINLPEAEILPKSTRVAVSICDPTHTNPDVTLLGLKVANLKAVISQHLAKDIRSALIAALNKE